MRHLHRTLAFFGILATGAIVQLAGCSDEANNCEANYEPCSTSSGSSSSSSGIIPPPPGCEKAPSEDAEVIRDDCAIFVKGSNGDDSNAGGEKAPVKTLTKALELAKTKGRVYLCGTVVERVEIPAGITIFGGFACDGADGEWAYDAAQRGKIAPDAPAADATFQASVRISGPGAVRIEDVDIEAKDAIFDGGSSIAVIIDNATVAFVRANLVAGNGSAGAKGATPMENIGPTDADDPAIKGNNGQTACMGGAMGNPGGAEKSNSMCSESIGGKGGNGQEALGDPGEGGKPTDLVFGLGGLGGTTQCMSGGNGANGSDGSTGTGATANGSISSTGFAGASGTTGGKGTAAQGGGGGGAVAGKAGCFGASGGSGGAGGCGGNGGLGGLPGGSSLGIVLVDGTVTFQDAKINTGNGGNGGNGGDGQFGAIGGNPGSAGAGNMGTKAACPGGPGGQGGNGGQGGGGRGGHSVGIAYKTGKTAPATTGVIITTSTPGDGGAGANAQGNGAAGAKDSTLAVE